MNSPNPPSYHPETSHISSNYNVPSYSQYSPPPSASGNGLPPYSFKTTTASSLHNDGNASLSRAQLGAQQTPNKYTSSNQVSMNPSSHPFSFSGENYNHTFLHNHPHDVPRASFSQAQQQGINYSNTNFSMHSQNTNLHTNLLAQEFPSNQGNNSKGNDKRNWHPEDDEWPTLPSPSPSPQPMQIHSPSPPNERSSSRSSPSHAAAQLDLPKLNHATPQTPHTPDAPPASTPSTISPIRSPSSSSSSSPRSSPPPSPRPTKRKRSDQERREKHNDTERKGRQKINSEIKVLKSLLPELQNSATPKVSILQAAVEALKHKTETFNSLMTQFIHVREENEMLRLEIVRLQQANHLRPTLSHLGHHPHQGFPLESEMSKRHEGYGFPKPLSAPSIPIPVVPTPSKQMWHGAHQ